MSLLSYVHVYTARIHEYAHILHSHTYIWTQTLKDTQLYIHQKTFMPTHKHVSTPTHILAHIHSCTHTRAHIHIHIHTHTHLHSRTSTYTHVCANANTYTCIQNKMHTQTLRTFTHKYTHKLTQAHEHASAHKIYRPTHKRTPVHSLLRVRAHTHKQYVLTCTLAQTYKHVCTQSLKLTHTHSRECA